MHENPPNTTVVYPAAPVSAPDLLTMLVNGLQQAGRQAQRMQAPRLQLEEFQPSTRQALRNALQQANSRA